MTSFYRSRAVLVLFAVAVLATGLVALGGAKQAWAESRGFAPAHYFRVGDAAPTVTADFNSDGKVDLAAKNLDSDSVSVLFGNGDGTFQAKLDFAVGAKPSSVTSADFNGDGEPDLATANFTSGNISVLLSNGDETFQAVKHSELGITDSSSGGYDTMTSTDFNGDNKVDLATTSYSSGSVLVYLGKGDGTFEAVKSFPVGDSPVSIASTDFDGDDEADLVTANNPFSSSLPNSISVLLGNGDGTFQAASNIDTASGPEQVITADFNGDSKVDLATTTWGSIFTGGGSVSVYLGNGDGKFQAPFNVVEDTDVHSYHPSSVTAADFNHDGNVDLAATDENGFGDPSDALVLLGYGDGTFQNPQNFAVEQYPGFIMGADLNADSYADLAVTGRHPSLSTSEEHINWVSVLLNIPVQDTTAPSTTPTLSPEPNAYGWNKEDVTLTLSATDDSGVKELTYAATGAQPIAEQTVQGGLATLPTITTEGYTTFTYHATDNVGNAEAEQTFTVMLDKTAPTSSASATVPDGSDAGSDPDLYTSGTLTNKDVTVELSAADGSSGSGVEEISYSINDGASQVYSGPFTVSSEGVSTISYYSTDYADNQEASAKTFTVQLDKTAPTSSASATVPDGSDTGSDPDPYTSGTWTNRNVTLTFSAEDGSGSGVNKTYYKGVNGVTDWTQVPSGGITVSAEGVNTVQYYSDDALGNAESPAKTFTVKLDKTAPTSSASATVPDGNDAGTAPDPYTSGTWTNRDVTLALSADDGSSGSGVKEIVYSINGGAIKTYNPTAKIIVSSEGESTISYYSTDNAGNQESPAKTFTVKLDKSAPTLDTTNPDSVEPDNGATGVSRDVEPEATFSDEMDPASINTSTVKLYQRKSGKWRLVRDTNVRCVDDPCHTVRLDPYPTAGTALAANQRYKVVVTTGAKNLAGIPLSSNKSWIFTTGSN